MFHFLKSIGICQIYSVINRKQMLKVPIYQLSHSQNNLFIRMINRPDLLFKLQLERI
jgi:hypothetical protein